MPSIGIYSYELYKFYGVNCIIRVGSAGSYKKDVKVSDVIIADKAYSESTFAKIAAGIDATTISAVGAITDTIKATAEKLDKTKSKDEENLKINLKSGLIHSSDVFYRSNLEDQVENQSIAKCLAVEMESFALFANAEFLNTSEGNLHNRNAACLLTISDSLVTGEAMKSEERETSFEKMIILALESAIAHYEKEKNDDNISN